MSNKLNNYIILSDGILFSKEIYQNESDNSQKKNIKDTISNDLTNSFSNFKKVPSEENLKKLVESSNNFLNEYSK